MVVALVLMTVFNQFNARQQSTAQAQLDYSQFLDEVKQGHIVKVVIEGRTLKATTNDGKRITSYAPSDLWMVSDLLKNGVKIEAKPEEEQSFLMSLFVSWFPMLLLIAVWVFFMRQMQGGKGGGAFSFGKSKARLLDDAKERVRLRTWPVATKPKKKFPSWWTSCAIPQNFRTSADVFRAAC